MISHDMNILTFMNINNPEDALDIPSLLPTELSHYFLREKNMNVYFFLTIGIYYSSIMKSQPEQHNAIIYIDPHE